MQIFIRTPAKKVMTLDVEPSVTVDDVKRMIYEKKGIPPDKQRLIFAGRRLKNECALSDYNIQEGSELFGICARKREDMQISVKSLTGKMLTLDVAPNKSIRYVKIKICHDEVGGFMLKSRCETSSFKFS